MKKEALIPPIVAPGSANPAKALRASRRKLAGMRSRAQFSALEARTLYSADLGVTAALPGADGPQVARAELVGPAKPAAYGRDAAVSDKAIADPAARDTQADKLAADALFKLVNDVRNPVSAAPLEIVLIDSRVQDVDALRQAFQAEIDGGRNLAVMVIDTQTDGISRVTQMLSMAGQKVSAIHIISHGQDGEFSLGATLVNGLTLEARSADLAGWSRYLSAGADVLIYGCDVAADQAGEQFLIRFGELTGTDVAASKDLTGASSLGGDWDLEYQSGQINRPGIATTDLQRTWQQILSSQTTPETTVNQTLTGDQATGAIGYLTNNGNTEVVTNADKSVSVNAAGDTAVTWTDLSSGKVFARTFHPNGSAITGEITIYDPAAEGISDTSLSGLTSASVTMRPDGSFVVTWAQLTQSTNDTIYAQRFTSEGLALGARITVSGASHIYMSLPEIDVDDNGNFVIAYMASDQAGLPAGTDPDWNVYVAGYKADGSVNFAPQKIDGPATLYFVSAKNPSVAMAGDGSFVVAYEQFRDWILTTTDNVIVARYNADGSANGGKIQVNALQPSYTPQAPTIDASRDGSFVVAFQNTSSTESQIIARTYNASGNPTAALQEISTADAFRDGTPSVAVDPNDGSKFVISWIQLPTSYPVNTVPIANIVTRGYNGLEFQSGLYHITNDSATHNLSPAVASNGNLISVTYNAAQAASAPLDFNVAMVNHIDDVNAYSAGFDPTIQAPSTQLMLEDGVLSLSLGAGNAIQIGDSDDAGMLSVTLSIPAGSGHFSIADTSMVNTLGGLPMTGAFSGTSLSFKGSLANINAALAQLVFTPVDNFNGTVNLSVSTTELYGASPATVSDQVAITISAVNDAPQLSGLTPLLTTMPGKLTLLASLGLTVQDVDAGAATLTVEAIALHGVVDLPIGSGVTFTSIDRTTVYGHERGVAMTGTLSQLNAALGSLWYTSDSAFLGTESIMVTVDDGGNSGAGGPLAAGSSYNLSVVADQAPVLNGTANSSATVAEDSLNTFANLFGAPALSISDADAGTSRLRLTIDVDNGLFTTTYNSGGLLEYGPDTPVNFPVSTSHIDVTGTVADLNSFLANLWFSPATNFQGTSTLTIHVDDQLGYAQSQVTSTRSITVVGVNDAPVATLGTLASAPLEDVRTTLGAMFPAIAVSDVDVGSNLVEVTVSVTSGTLHLDTPGMNLFSSVDNSLLTVDLTGTSITFRGSLADVNAALPQMFYTSALNVNGGGFYVTLAVNDLGNNNGPLVTGLNATQSRIFSITAIDDAPLLNMGASSADVTEDTPVLLSSLMSNLLNVSDVDAGTSPMKLTVSVDQGDMQADLSGLNLTDAVSGLSLNSTVTASHFQLVGTQSQLSSALQRIYYRPAANAVAPVALNISIDDLGNSGTITDGTASLSASEARTLNVVAVNDTPVINMGLAAGPLTEDMTQSIGTMFPTISISDIDAGSGNMLLTLTAGQGTLSLNTTGLGLLDASTGNVLSGVVTGTSISFKAPLSALNSALPQVMFTPDANLNGTGFSLAVAVDDLGNTGLVSLGTGTAGTVRYFSLVAANDAPVFQAGTLSSNIAENATTPLVSLFSGALSISDIDAGTSPLKLSLNSTLGGFSLDSTGLSLFDANTGTPLGNPVGNSSLAITGSLADLNVALQRIQFTPATNSNDSALITLSIDDLGNTGTLAGGVNGVDDLAVLVDVAPLDNKPVITLGPMFTTVMEDTPVTLGTLYPSMSISDVDAGSGNLQVTLQATGASLSINTTGLGLLDTVTGASLTGVIQGASISFKAPLATLNAVLPQVLFTPDLNANGTGFALQVVVDDLGNTGAVTVAGTTDSALSYFTVSAVNDAPVISIGSQTSDIAEDTPVILASLFGGDLSIADVDAGSNPVDLTVTVSQGNMSLDITGLSLTNPTTGLSFTSNQVGASIHLRGTVSQLNAALQVLQYQTDPNLTTPVTLSFHVDDLGNSGSGSVTGQVSEFRTLAVGAYNDPPVAQIGAPVSQMLEDTPLTLGTIFSSISVSDVDAGNGDLLITLTSAKGSLSLNTSGFGLLDSGTGAALTGTLTGTSISFRGSLTAINNALPQVLFTPTTNSNGTGFSVTMSVDDRGNTGAAVTGATVVTATQSFSVIAVNDLAKPNISATATPVVEDTPTRLGDIYSSIAISDPDSGSGLMRVTLSVNKGSLSFDTSGQNLFDAGTGAALNGALTGATISFQGTKASVNAALPNIIFTPSVNTNGSGYTLSLTVDDQGSTGLAPASTTPITLIRNFSVTEVNDAPVLNAQNIFNGIEDTPLVFSATSGNLISISDPDGNVSVTIDLSVNHGLLSLGSLAGLNFSNGDGSADSAMRFTGTVAQLNAALSGLTFTPDKDFAGDANLTVKLDDNGNTGSGGAKNAQSELALRMAQVNDAPVVAATGSVSQDAGALTTVNATLLKVTDIESGADQIIYTLTAVPAQGNLNLNGTSLLAGATFTQADVNAGRVSYVSSPAAGGADAIKLSVKDGNGAGAAPIELSVAVKATPAFQGSSDSSSSSGSGNASSTNSASTTTANAASKAAAPDASAAAAAASANAVAGGSAAGASFTNAPGSEASNAQKQAGSNAGLTTGLANMAPTNANAAALSAQGRGDAGRLPDAPMPSLAPLANAAPPVASAVASGEAARPAEIERPMFVTPGITLPTQGISLDKIAGDNSFHKEMEKVREDVMHVAALDRGVVASTIGVSASFTLGYILWLVRGGVLISSLLASLPAWRMVDPLPVLGNLGNTGNNKDDKSLEELVEHKNDVEKDVEQPEEETA